MYLFIILMYFAETTYPFYFYLCIFRDNSILICSILVAFLIFCIYNIKYNTNLCTLL